MEEKLQERFHNLCEMIGDRVREFNKEGEQKTGQITIDVNITQGMLNSVFISTKERVALG
jgi:hypothetical protein